MFCVTVAKYWPAVDISYFGGKKELSYLPLLWCITVPFQNYLTFCLNIWS